MYIVGVALAAFLLFPIHHADAQTPQAFGASSIAELQKRINELLKQVEELRDQLEELDDDEDDEDDDDRTISDIKEINVTLSSTSSRAQVAVDMKSETDFTFSVNSRPDGPSLLPLPGSAHRQQITSAIGDTLASTHDFDFREFRNKNARNRELAKLIEWKQTNLAPVDDDDDDDEGNTGAGVQDVDATVQGATVTLKIGMRVASSQGGWFDLLCLQKGLGTVEWGDGKSNSIRGSGCLTGTRTVTMRHTYAATGTYAVKVTDTHGNTERVNVTISSRSNGGDSLGRPGGTPAASNAYDIDDVSRVTARNLLGGDYPSPVVGSFVEYTITLKDGKVHKVRWYGNSNAQLEQQLRATGYTGTVKDILDKV